MEFLLALAISCTVNFHNVNEAVCNKWTEKARDGSTIYKVQIVNTTKIDINTFKTDIRTVGRCSYLGAKIARPYIKKEDNKWCLDEP